MTFHPLNALQRLQPERMLVVGDAMLDRYVFGNAERVSPEAPVIVLQADEQEVRPGGAASVAVFLRGLGAVVSLAGVVGDDSAGSTLRALCRDEQIDDSLLLTDANRPTTLKERFLGRAEGHGGQQMLRVDHESRQGIEGTLLNTLKTELSSTLGHIDAILIADYAKGVCTPEVVSFVIGQARERDIPVLVDPGRGRPIDSWAGATVLKPNRSEAAAFLAMSHPTVTDISAGIRDLRMNAGVESLVVTLDGDGCVYTSADSSEVCHIPADHREVHDITGAGDMFLATLGLAFASGLSLSDSTQLATATSTIEVTRAGCCPLRLEELWTELAGADSRRQLTESKVTTLDELQRIIPPRGQRHQRVVFTNGCFDLLHIGHASYLQEAARLGDILIVAVNSDDSVRRLKGRGRPVVPAEDRAALIASLACVDHVLIFEEDTPHPLLQALQPDLLVKGGTYSLHEVVGREVVESYGGQVCVADELPGHSTTALVTAIRSHDSCP